MNSLKAICSAAVLGIAAIAAPLASADAPGYRVLQKIASEAAGTVDAMAIDSAARRLYAAREGGVDVYDVESGKKVGGIATTGAPGSIKLASDVRRGYVSNRDSGTVTLFDLETLQAIATVKSGGREPREIEYDSKTRRIYVSNSGSGELAVLDAVTGSNRGSVKLGGRLRQSVADGRGNLFIADERANALHIIDTDKLQSLGKIPVWPGEAPTALVNDTKERRIYVACGNGKMIIVDPDPGQMIGMVPTQGKGEAGIAAQFAPARLVMLYMPNASGTLDVVQNAKLTATLDQSIDLGVRSTAAAFDEKSGRLYVAGGTELLAIGK
ncbi:YncE family protein [Steroidobacter sp.]|uniref:YncE family protein n=1 Tax=Steroidobacter sp. TaxID=1978227 RepID=UPI001A3C522B|nr:YncE family protein [Steroidobacter sp.]MBL8269340.1 YncE family protein [Steroidobacter sp.]